MKPTLSLIGYGRMGKEIHALALEQTFDVRSIIDPDYTTSTSATSSVSTGAQIIDSTSLNGAEVALEFTQPTAVIDNIHALAKTGVHMVVGTTGWDAHRDDIRALVESTGTGLLYANNFSVGIHLFRKLAAFAASLLNSYSQYDLALHEIHHNRKKDAPSGTALLLADDILRKLDKKTAVAMERPDGIPDESELLISSSRVGSVPGTHTIIIDGPADSLELVHRARSRRGFAEGALMAATWIAKKKGFYSIEEMFDDIESL